MTVEIPKACTNKACEGDQLSWMLSTMGKGNANSDGRGAFSEARPVLVLGCDECSETVHIVESDGVVNALMRPTVVVEVPATLAQVRRWKRIERAAQVVLRAIHPRRVDSQGHAALGALGAELDQLV